MASLLFSWAIGVRNLGYYTAFIRAPDMLDIVLAMRYCSGRFRAAVSASAR